MSKLTRISAFFLLILLTVALSGCLGFLGGDSETNSGGAILGTDTAQPLTGEGTMVCSQACVDRAQCGSAPALNNTQYVLLNTQSPEVRNHNMILGAGTPVQILQSRDLSVQKVSDPSQLYTLRFYQVSVADREPGWVSGWCVQQP